MKRSSAGAASSACALTRAVSAPKRSVMLAALFEALVGLAGPDRVASALRIQHQHGQRQVGQRALARGDRVGRVTALDLVGLIGGDPVVAQCGPIGLARPSRRCGWPGVHHVELLGDVGLAGQGEGKLLNAGSRSGWRNTARMASMNAVDSTMAGRPAKRPGCGSAPGAGWPPSG